MQTQFTIPTQGQGLYEFTRSVSNRINVETGLLITHTYEGPDDMPAHIKAAMMPVSLNIPIVNGTLALGTWQGIYLFEHRDAPHQRRVVAHVSGS